MKKGILTILVVAIATLFGGQAFGQTDFDVENASGYQLWGIMVSQDGGADWTGDLLTEDEFLDGTTTTITIPAGYTCQIYVKVSYMVDGEIYEEVIARANVCEHSGIYIQANPSGSGGHWMTTQYMD